MIHIIVNGLLVEAETVMSVHAAIEIRRYSNSRHEPVKEKDNPVLTEIMREVLKQIKGE